MGKRDKRKKDGERATKKTERKAEKKLLKTEKESGQQELEAILKEYEEKRKMADKIEPVESEPPSPRSHFSFTASPESHEIILFGGEYFNGKRNFMYDELFIFDCKSATWTLIKSTNKPSPRCSHQTVVCKVDSQAASMWLFGGEYASETQSRFAHFKDLWKFNINLRKWELINLSGSTPCARSGHRMARWRQGFLLFGGFSDSGVKTNYFGDMWQFSIPLNAWTKISLPSTPTAVAARSAGLFFTSADSRSVYLVGGYSVQAKAKKFDTGFVHTDHLQLVFDGQGAKEPPKINSLRPNGCKPNPPRTGMSAVQWRPNQAIVFGGVNDEETEDGEEVRGHFWNQLCTLELDKSRWHPFRYNRPKQQAIEGHTASDAIDSLDLTDRNVPDPRMHCGMAVQGNYLYIYGGTVEHGDVRVTLDDLHRLDLSNPVKWECIHAGTAAKQQWMDSENEEGDDDDDMSTDSEDEDDEEVEMPLPVKGEDFGQYFERCKNSWCSMAADDGSNAMETDCALADWDTATVRLAQKMAKQFFRENQS